jgi:GNAT superfamily N-acetyltransferase
MLFTYDVVKAMLEETSDVSNDVRFVSAVTLPLTIVAETFTRSFEGYFYPMTMTAPLLTTRARVEQLDFSHSLVMLHNDEPAGIAMLACRDRDAWCGGFGIASPFRGRGLARRLGEAMLEQARLVGATRLSLEVLTRNTGAIQVYQALGLSVVRDLHLFEWNGDDAGSQASQAQETCTSAQPHDLLQHFIQLHPVKAAWQRDLPALLVRSGMHGLAWKDDVGHHAYVLFSVRDTTARIEDLGATRAEDAIHILQSLQANYAKLVSVNEPGDSPSSAAFLACNFQEVDRQHEMVIQL